MGGYERQNRASSASSIDTSSPARVTLPSDLAGSLKYLEDAQLQILLEAVTVEIDRRRQGTSRNRAATVAATRTSSQGQSGAPGNRKIKEIDEIPEGKANLIRASFRAGIKPAVIARTFRISQSLVNRVLSSTEKSKR
jgi:DNA invertase Pin-like site-specific DNA recombinase